MQADLEPLSQSGWRALYLAALFEPNSATLLERIAEAEHAINLRVRELWYSNHRKIKISLGG